MEKKAVLIKDSNKFIFSRDGLKSHHFKVLGLALMKLQTTKDISKPVQVSFPEYKKWTGDIAPNYTRFKKTLKQIHKTVISIETNDFNWVDHSVITETEGKLDESGEPVIEVTFNPKMEKFLFPAINDQIYTPISYAYQCQLKGAYSVKIYRGLKTKYWHLEKDRNISFLEMTVEEFKLWLGIESKYSEMKNLKMRVLKPSCEEISKKTDIYVTFEEIQKPEKKIRFLIQKNIHPELDKLYLEPVQTGFFDENEQLNKIWNPERLAQIFEKIKPNQYASKDMAFIAEMASKHKIEVQKVDGRFEFKSKIEDEKESSVVILTDAQQKIVTDAKNLGYRFTENWNSGSKNSVREEIGKALNFIESKRLKIAGSLAQNEITPEEKSKWSLGNLFGKK